MMVISRKNISDFLFISSLILLAIGLPLGKSFINIAQGSLGAAWLLEDNHGKRIRSFFTNKITLFIFAVYVLHIIGLFYSTDIKYALDDIRKKLPLFVITFTISTYPKLNQKYLTWILGVFCSAVILSTLISFGILHGIITSKKVIYPVRDIREISIFVSHIRLSLFCTLSIIIMSFYIIQKNNLILKVLALMGVSWLLFYMKATGSLTGILVLLIIILALSIQVIISKKSTLQKRILSGIIISGYLFTTIYIVNTYQKNTVQITSNNVNIKSKTLNGNSYDEMTDAPQTEDGKRIYNNYSRKELYAEWPKYSKLSLDSPTTNNIALLYSLVRYMTSLDLNKDSAGLTMLKPQDIKNIESGLTNFRQANMNVIEKRIYEINWEFQEFKNTGDANGHTLAQRYVYWTSGLSIIKKNLLFGIGTGDVQNELFSTYEKNVPNLNKKYYLRTHNQYITIAIAFGMVGLVLFIISLFYPLLINKNYQNPLYLSFFIIVILSMFTEDTLETLAGVSFYAFFNSFFLFSLSKD